MCLVVGACRKHLSMRAEGLFFMQRGGVRSVVYLFIYTPLLFFMQRGGVYLFIVCWRFFSPGPVLLVSACPAHVFAIDESAVDEPDDGDDVNPDERRDLAEPKADELLRKWDEVFFI